MFAASLVETEAAGAVDEASGNVSAAEAVKDYYPKAAQSAGVEGTATLTCSMTEKYTLSACKLDYEYPKGWGFGDAAMALAQQSKARAYVMRPSLTGPITFLFNLHPPAILPNVLNADQTYISPNFLVLPDTNKLQRMSAHFGSLRGRVVLDCVVGLDQMLTGCIVVDEPSTGSIEGRVALEWAHTLSLRPMIIDGKSEGGAHVLIPIAFGDHR